MVDEVQNLILHLHSTDMLVRLKAAYAIGEDSLRGLIAAQGQHAPETIASASHLITLRNQIETAERAVNSNHRHATALHPRRLGVGVDPGLAGVLTGLGAAIAVFKPYLDDFLKSDDLHIEIKARNDPAVERTIDGKEPVQAEETDKRAAELKSDVKETFAENIESEQNGGRLGTKPEDWSEAIPFVGGLVTEAHAPIGSPQSVVDQGDRRISEEASTTIDSLFREARTGNVPASNANRVRLSHEPSEEDPSGTSGQAGSKRETGTEEGPAAAAQGPPRFASHAAPDSGERNGTPTGRESRVALVRIQHEIQESSPGMKPDTVCEPAGQVAAHAEMVVGDTSTPLNGLGHDAHRGERKFLAELRSMMMAMAETLKLVDMPNLSTKPRDGHLRRPIRSRTAQKR